MKLAEPSTHIAIDEKDRAYIAGTRIRVSQIAIEHLHWKASPSAIVMQYPQLTLGQVHAALAYYFDHAESIDAEITNSENTSNVILESLPESPLATRAKTAGNR